MKYIFLFMFLLPLLAIAQKPLQISKWQRQADDAFTKHNYFDAIDLYKHAYEDLSAKNDEKTRKQRANILFQIAECYRYINDYKQQEQWYDKALKKHCDDSTDAATYYRIAHGTLEKYRARDTGHAPVYRQYKKTDDKIDE